MTFMTLHNAVTTPCAKNEQFSKHYELLSSDSHSDKKRIEVNMVMGIAVSATACGPNHRAPRNSVTAGWEMQNFMTSILLQDFMICSDFVCLKCLLTHVAK